MLGIILAAGRGSRMGALTAQRPKALVRLAGKTLLEWQREALSQAGVSEVWIVTGYLAHQFAQAGGRRLHNPRWRESNMVRSLMCAGELLATRDALVSYSDIVYHPDAVRAVLACEAPIAVAYDRRWEDLWRERFEDPLRDAESFRAEDGLVIDIGRRVGDLAQIQGQYMGLLGIRRRGWAAITGWLAGRPPAEVDALDMTGLLRALLETDCRIGAVPVDGKWCEVDSPADAALCERRLAESARTGLRWTHDWRTPA